MKFLVRAEIVRPAAASDEVTGELVELEALRAAELFNSGNLIQLWRISGRWANVGVWSASGRGELEDLLRSLPLRPWMTIAVDDIEVHPNQPSAYA